MAKLWRIVLIAFLLAAPAWARQVSEWKSTSGSQVTIMGSENMSFQIQIVTPQGQSFIYDAWWIEVRNSFGYRAQGKEYYCTYTNKGWSILAKTQGTTNRWDFVRWISK